MHLHYPKVSCLRIVASPMNVVGRVSLFRSDAHQVELELTGDALEEVHVVFTQLAVHCHAVYL